jgi:hypothetical protein
MSVTQKDAPKLSQAADANRKIAMHATIRAMVELLVVIASNIYFAPRFFKS